MRIIRMLTGLAAVVLASGCLVLAGGSSSVLAAGSGLQSPGWLTVAPPVPWGTAEEVPGSAALNTGEYAYISSLSCATAGNCSAGGYYGDSSGHSQGFVVSETDGVWGTAEKVPGLAALNTGEYAQITSLSCGAAGNCSAGGYYSAPSYPDLQAFVVGKPST
jgi:hypothetical protein